MKMKKALAIALSVFFVTSIIPTMAVLAETQKSDLSFKSSWIEDSTLFNGGSSDSYGYYFYVSDYDTYKLYENYGLIAGYNENFFNDNMLLVNSLYCFSGSYGDYEDPIISVDENKHIVFDYKCNIIYPPNPIVRYQTNYIEFIKSDVKDVDFSQMGANICKVYEYRDGYTENITFDMKYVDLENNEPDPTKPTTSTKVTKPAKVTKLKAIAKKKKLKVSWKNVSGAKGYEVKVATNNKFTKNKKTVTVKKNKTTLKDLKSKKKYFVKVRAYKTVKGTKYFGKWSKVVNKKTK